MQKIPMLTARQLRTITVMRARPVMREELDHISKSSNSPEIVAQLRRKGLDIQCKLIDCIDGDGLPCQPGRYELTPGGHETLRHWGLGLA